MKRLYTQEEDAFLKKHINNYAYKELVSALNAESGNQRTVTAIKKHCRDVLKIISDRKGTFEQGGDTYNQKTIGDEKWENGYLWVKVDDIKEKHRGREAYRKNWKQKHLLVWESFYGNVPKGKQVAFLDGNKANYDITNLNCVDIRIMIVMNRNKWFTKNRENTLTGIKWCELFYAMAEGKENNV